MPNPHSATGGQSGAPNAAVAYGQALGLSGADIQAIWASTGDLASFKNEANNIAGSPGPGGGTAPATAGGTSSGYSSGGGSGYAGMSPAQKKNLEASFIELLHSWGLKPDGKLAQLIKQGVNGEWGMAMFTNAVRRTREYKQQFPGIQWKSGMSESEYNSKYRQYVELAKNAPYNLSRDGFADLLKKGVDAAEWNERVKAYASIKANKGLLEEFTDILNERGLIKGKMTPKELKDFVTGKGSKQWTSLWNQAAVGAGLESIGFTVGEGGDLSRRDLLQLLKSPLAGISGPGQTIEVDYRALAEAAARGLPASRLYGMGITKKDLVTMALGGAAAKPIADRLQLAIGTATAAATEQRANPQLTPYGMVTDQRKRQATE